MILEYGDLKNCVVTPENIDMIDVSEIDGVSCVIANISNIKDGVLYKGDDASYVCGVIQSAFRLGLPSFSIASYSGN